ncbi:MAG: zinc-ribbon domain-containing protein [Desulfuromonadaceae bacterium]|nr:zinc-ribbon domain-containing protein [Desulfuromonadaceae bacterium]MDD2855108.1 zinc-ribbon domain-containing protein [Desulfuromonadaceae bacterium]
MKITCPKCGAKGTIPDHEVPETGRFIDCPRCHEGFTVQKERAGNDAYLVDTCPACSFSTFGDETFGTCPKCGVAIKVFVERKREEQRLIRNQELLEKKFSTLETTPVAQPEKTAAPVADFIENLHPVNLIGGGAAALSLVAFCAGLWGIISYDSAAIQAQLLDVREERVSIFNIFLRYGLLHWIELIYGVCGATTALFFHRRLKKSLPAMSYMIWVTMALVPIYYIISFVSWVLAPIPHTVSGYLIEIFNIIVMSTLVGVPLYILENYLHERKITSVINQ